MDQFSRCNVVNEFLSTDGVEQKGPLQMGEYM